MNDQQKLGNLKLLLDHAQRLAPADLESALQIAESVEDQEDRGYCIGVIAERVAATGDLDEVNRALELVESIKVLLDKFYALEAFAVRLSLEQQKQQSMEVLAKAKDVASKIEESEEYLKWQQGQAWSRIGKVYQTLGEYDRALESWARAIELLQLGQRSDNPQEAIDSAGVFTDVLGSLARAGYEDRAKALAQSITIAYKKENAVKIISKAIAEKK